MEKTAPQCRSPQTEGADEVGMNTYLQAPTAAAAVTHLTLLSSSFKYFCRVWVVGWMMGSRREVIYSKFICVIMCGVKAGLLVTPMLEPNAVVVCGLAMPSVPADPKS